MSKGPGKWQRLILDALETQDRVFIRDILPRWKRCKPSDYKAFRRAAGKLQESGMIILRQGWKDDKPGWINDQSWFGEYASKPKPGEPVKGKSGQVSPNLIQDLKRIVQDHHLVSVEESNTVETSTLTEVQPVKLSNGIAKC